MGYTYEWRIRSGDTDWSGRIYTPAVIDQLLRGKQRMLDDIGFRSHEDEGVSHPTVHLEADYLAPVGIGDVVTVEIIPEVGDTSITYRATGTVDGETGFEASVTQVFVDRAGDGSPMPVPDAVRRGLAVYADG